MVIANRKDGGVVYWLAKLYLFAAAVIVALGLVYAFLIYRDFAREAPETPDLSTYLQEVAGVSRMTAADGTALGTFADEWRNPVAYLDVPQQLIDAVLAAEDHQFFSHQGIYFKGVFRALWANVTAGDFAQGASTITQQVAKQFLSSEKSLTRKAIEAILARRLEATYSKRAILSVYLNHIFLGNGAYGVRAAARRYFNKNLDELTVAESALLAGLAQAPSRYSPTSRPELAIARRDVVLDKMQAHGFATAEVIAKAKAEPLVLAPQTDEFPRRSPYFAEHVRRIVASQHGIDALQRGGLKIETTLEPAVDALAYDTTEYSAHKQDQRQGWRGPEWRVDGAAKATFIERATAHYGDAPLDARRRYLGLVEETTSQAATVRIGATTYRLPLANMDWAAKWSITDSTNDHLITDVKSALRPGDIIWVRPKATSLAKFDEWFLADGINPRWRSPRTPKEGEALTPTELLLDQPPHPQAAIFSGDHRTGYVVAMVGGTDYSRSEYNRATQACRQPGSTYKPIYYAAALDEGYGFDTILNDTPRAEIDPVTGEVWTPENFHGTVDDEVSLEYALVFSKNIPSVGIFNRVGAHNVHAWARRLGFTTLIIADQALALGASCALLNEMARAFGIYAAGGEFVTWHSIRRVTDRAGNVLQDHTVVTDPYLSTADRLDRIAAVGGDKRPQAISPRTAFLITKILANVINYGFSNILRQTGINAAGKTGTSSATMDMSFVGFTNQWVTAVWLGDDLRVRPLGKHDAAYMTVVPMWARFMAAATAGQANDTVPPGPPEGVSARDRGDHSKGATGPQSNLVYIRHTPPPTE